MPYSVWQWARLGANAGPAAGLDTARERAYADGMYVRYAPVVEDLALSVAEDITVTDVATPFLPPTGGVSLVPVLIPSYRRRRMV